MYITTNDEITNPANGGIATYTVTVASVHRSETRAKATGRRVLRAQAAGGRRRYPSKGDTVAVTHSGPFTYYLDPIA